jgi:signal transduction histidine kinase
MLRRTRLTLPLLAVVAALAGGLVPERVLIVAVVMAVAGIAIDVVMSRVEEARLARVADQVVAFASDEERPPELTVEGGQQWQRIVGALDDIARILRERFEALRTERRRVQRLLEVMPSGVLLFTADGLVYANPQAIELFDLTDPLGLTPLRVLGDRGLQQAVTEAAETRKPITIQVSRDGRELMGTATSIAPAEVALIITDLTDVRRVEAMRRDFVANASHELKTPVTGMQALADSLHMAMDRDPDRAVAMVERIQLEATRLARLVRDLLDLTRLEEGGDDRTTQRIDLVALCENQIDRLRVVAEQSEVELALETTGETMVIGLPEDVRLIVSNLIRNAVQYNRPQGTVVVRVGREESVAVVQVVDTGIGIAETEQDRIFERFYRVDKARSRASGGTGLGLSLVRNAVERHSGTVDVSSVLGEGSTFTVRLPVDGGA